jgi:tetratricopeptide (TPR) repeat protein
MKKAILTMLVLTFICGISLAQDPGDEAYIKAMQANTPAERATLLKEFLAKYGGQGNKYDNYANANLCTIGWPGKTDQETLSYGEKALTLGGLDDIMKCQILMSLSATYTKQGQNYDKAKAYANQIIQIATAGKSKEPEAAHWNKMIGAGYYLMAQAQHKSRETRAAIDSYTNSHAILKDPQILGDMKKLAKELYDAKAYGDAGRIFRFLVQVNPRDAESQTLIAQCLYKEGKTDEAMTMWKEAFGRSKSADLAYNIGITLAKEAKANPSLLNDAIRYLIDAALLSAKYKDAMSMAENLFLGHDKEYNNRVKLMQDSKQLIDEWIKTINTRFGNKSEDELSSDEKREYRKIKENIDKEQKTLDDLQAKHKAATEGFTRILAEEKQKLGVK